MFNPLKAPWKLLMFTLKKVHNLLLTTKITYFYKVEIRLEESDCPLNAHGVVQFHHPWYFSMPPDYPLKFLTKRITQDLAERNATAKHIEFQSLNRI